jgi:hypothetical protein
VISKQINEVVQFGVGAKVSRGWRVDRPALSGSTITWLFELEMQAHADGGSTILGSRARTSSGFSVRNSNKEVRPRLRAERATQNRLRSAGAGLAHMVG